MKKKKILCGALLASTMIGMVSCNSSEDFEVLSRKDFAENVFQKDSSQIVRFDLNSLTEKEKDELNAFRNFSKAIVSPSFVANNTFKTRAITNYYGIDTSDMDQSSPLVKIINAMSDPEVANALQNNDAVVADVIVIGASMADNGANVLQAVENGDILSLDLQKIGGDEIINKKIDDTILKSLVLQGETHSKIETVQNIAKATYYEFK